MAGLQNNKGLPKLGGSSSGLPKLGSSPMSGLPKLGSLSSKKVELPKLKLGAAAAPSAKKSPAIGATLIDEEANTAENTVDALLDALGIGDTGGFDEEESETLVVNRSSLDLVEMGSDCAAGQDGFDPIDVHEGTMVTPPPKFDAQSLGGGASSVSMTSIGKPELAQGADAFSVSQSEGVLSGETHLPAALETPQLPSKPRIAPLPSSVQVPVAPMIAPSVPVMAPLPAAPVAAQSVPVMAPPAAPVAAQSVPVMAPPAAPVAAPSVPVMAPPAAPVAAPSVPVMA
ncbi:MAG: hypothetical protein IJ165_02655, partial [Proteobacteria bacterium]|nr:hypothetical protein [Pseudomonadota bacterium]